MNAYDHIILSPHFDDAALSCGGTIHHACQHGQAVLTITIFAAPPAVPLSPLAQKVHASMGTPADVGAARRSEDREAMNLLGADVLWLDFRDCIYRGRPAEQVWYYPSEQAIFSTIHKEESTLDQEIAAAIRRHLPATSHPTIYAPLAVGHHVDHQLVHAAAWKLHDRGWQVVFYEDFPYAEPGYTMFADTHPYTLDATLTVERNADLQPQVNTFSEEDVDAKIRSVRAYRSQLALLFGDDTTVECRIRSFASGYGSNGPAERVWIPG